MTLALCLERIHPHGTYRILQMLRPSCQCTYHLLSMHDPNCLFVAGKYGVEAGVEPGFYQFEFFHFLVFNLNESFHLNDSIKNFL